MFLESIIISAVSAAIPAITAALMGKKRKSQHIDFLNGLPFPNGEIARHAAKNRTPRHILKMIERLAPDAPNARRK